MLSTLEFHPVLQKNLTVLGFEQATDVQEQAIPPLLEGKDVLISAATGTGKTLAYLLPVMQSLASNISPWKTSQKSGPRALILLPVRELAEQLLQLCKKLSVDLNLQAVSLVGGQDFKVQEKALASADIVIATPGRLLPHLENETVSLVDLDLLVLDEADRMLETGFKESLENIFNHCSGNPQTVLVSATLPNNIRKLSEQMLQEPVRIRIGHHRVEHENIKQFILLSDDPAHKDKQLTWLLENEQYDKAVVFTNSKTQAKRLDGYLRYKKLKVALLHGDVQQKGRFATIEGFRKGTTRILVTTDLAARGLDVEGVDLVVNVEMPRKGDLYVHRIGRTGRAGAEGQAISLISPSEWNLMSSIERYLKLRFRRKQIDSLMGSYKGPKKLKSSGKAAGTKKKKASQAKKKKLKK